jgi:dsRNA-specific ribonuclease
VSYNTRELKDGGFASSVIYHGEVLGSGRGRRKKDAEQAAAAEALERRKYSLR